MEYQRVTAQSLTPALFAGFDRYQLVTQCWRKEAGKWAVKPIAFIEQWHARDYAFLLECLQNTLATGGVVFAALEGERLLGFCSAESGFLGSKREYLELSSLHVSAESRGQGIGRRLFELACDWARAQGAKKLYISAHSSVETQAFYKAMGCVEAREYDARHVAAEPFDCQLERPL